MWSNFCAGQKRFRGGGPSARGPRFVLATPMCFLRYGYGGAPPHTPPKGFALGNPLLAFKGLFFVSRGFFYHNIKTFLSQDKPPNSAKTTQNIAGKKQTPCKRRAVWYNNR